MRIALGLEYAGEHFCGWQFQPHCRSVQGCVEQALTQVAQQPIQISCAGRTDTGVHALAQVIHMDVMVQRTMRSWVFGANSNLTKEISILWAKVVDEHFHARFSAQARHYRYVILNRPTRPALWAHRVTWAYRPLEVTSMQAAADYLIGRHDFTSFRALACQAKHPIRTITRLNVSRQDDFVIINITANAFLHHMVRNIAGVLMAIGYGQHPPQWAQTVLAARDRTVAAVTAPASGLYLSKIDYPEHYALPKSTTLFPTLLSMS